MELNVFSGKNQARQKGSLPRQHSGFLFFKKKELHDQRKFNERKKVIKATQANPEARKR